ncbi:MAG TPA: hypothetical protein VHP31_11430 [Caproicibacter sp.]|nr:hypothetical protein [Caproicibacter sp.]
MIQNVVKEHYSENLSGNGIKWNFTKFLVSADGSEIRRFEPSVTPQELDSVIADALKG